MEVDDPGPHTTQSAATNPIGKTSLQNPMRSRKRTASEELVVKILIKKSSREEKSRSDTKPFWHRAENQEQEMELFTIRSAKKCTALQCKQENFHFTENVTLSC